MTRRAVWKRKMALTGNVETALIKSYVRLAKIPIDTFKIIGMHCTFVEQIVHWYLRGVFFNFCHRLNFS